MEPYKFAIKVKKNLKNFMIGEIALVPEEGNMNKWSMIKVISIQKDSDGFVWSVNIVFGANALKMFGT